MSGIFCSRCPCADFARSGRFVEQGVVQPHFEKRCAVSVPPKSTSRLLELVGHPTPTRRGGWPFRPTNAGWECCGRGSVFCASIGFASRASRKTCGAIYESVPRTKEMFLLRTLQNRGGPDAPDACGQVLWNRQWSVGARTGCEHRTGYPARLPGGKRARSKPGRARLSC